MIKNFKGFIESSREERKAILSFNIGKGFEEEIIKKDKNLFKIVINFTNMNQMDKVIESLKKNKIHRVVFENLNTFINNKEDKEIFFNKLSYQNIKYFDIKDGSNNYVIDISDVLGELYVERTTNKLNS